MSAQAIERMAKDIAKHRGEPAPNAPKNTHNTGLASVPVDPKSLLGYYQVRLAEADAVIQSLTRPQRHHQDTDYLVLLSQWTEDSQDRWNRYPQGK